jgi:hypothetical protein
MKKCMVLVIAVFLGMSTAALADAVDGNVYNVAYFPKPLGSADNTGNFGYINIQLTSGPNCTGSMLAGSANFCTIDANANMCDPTYRYTEAGILALYDQLARALTNGGRLRLFTSDPGRILGQYVRFLAQ